MLPHVRRRGTGRLPGYPRPPQLPAEPCHPALEQHWRGAEMLCHSGLTIFDNEVGPDAERGMHTHSAIRHVPERRRVAGNLLEACFVVPDSSWLSAFSPGG